MKLGLRKSNGEKRKVEAKLHNTTLLSYHTFTLNKSPDLSSANKRRSLQPLSYNRAPLPKTFQTPPITHQKTKDEISSKKYITRQTFEKRKQPTGPEALQEFVKTVRRAKNAHLDTRKSVGVQKTCTQYKSINFSNVNLHRLYKDIAIKKIVSGKGIERISATDSQGINCWASAKKVIIRHSICMIQQHIFFDEFLKNVEESGVDVELLVQKTYQRLKGMVNTNNLLVSESDSPPENFSEIFLGETRPRLETKPLPPLKLYLNDSLNTSI